MRYRLRSLASIALWSVAIIAGLPVCECCLADDEAAPPTPPAAADVAPAPASQPEHLENVLLDNRSLCRVRTVWESREVMTVDGKAVYGKATVNRDAGNYYKSNPTAGQLPTNQYTVTTFPDTICLPADTPADWMKPEFDDGGWARLCAPVLDKANNEDWKLILLRGLFEVTDPAKVGDLRLSLSFKGGAVVYLNGQELTRAFMPEGPVDTKTPASVYPDEVYFNADGFAMFRYPRAPGDKPRLAKRVRNLTNFAIPAGSLKKGVNVLAIAVHRAPTLAKFQASRLPAPAMGLHEDCFWSHIGLLDFQLVAPPGAAVVANVELVKNRGFKVWNQSIIQAVYFPDYPDPFSPLKPVQLTGVRNGTFAGQVVIGDDQPIKGLKAQVSDLSGQGEQGGKIAAAAVRVRYGAISGVRTKLPFFDALEDDPPAEIPVMPEHGGAVQPLWFTVTVPADAKSGDYAGTVTISAEGVKPVVVPIRLHVIDWTLPPPSKYTARLDIIQSPDSVAMAYDVPMWSDAHWKLLDRTFALLGELGTKTLFITCIRRTHFGNEHAMVRWTRDAEGELIPDFTIAEKYLDTAIKHMGPIPGVILYCWEPPQSQGHAGVRIWDKPVLISVLDPKTGELSARQGPALGSPESKPFWKKLSDGMTDVLKKRGLEKSMLFGLVGDSRPTKIAMEDMCNGVADPRWAVHSHYYCDEWQGYKMGLVSALWGIGCQPADPADGYSFGWSNPLWMSYFPREMHPTSTLVEFRTKLEEWVGAKTGGTPFISKGRGPRSLSRIGGDFWEVVKDERGRVRSNIVGRYPEAAWGQLSLNNCNPYLLGRGVKGAVATVRSEAMGEGMQEVEARIFVEKALLDDEAKTLLGEDLIKRCRAALDERIRMCLHSAGEGQPWYISSGWDKRNELLFRLAAEVAKKLGREPNPNLTMPLPKKP